MDPENEATQENRETSLQLFDKWGFETGRNSKYLQAFAARQNFYRGKTVTDQNLANNFKEYERRQAWILINQIRDMLVNLFRYRDVPVSLNTAMLEMMLRQLAGGICVGKNEIGELVILGRADELGVNGYGSIIPSTFDSGHMYLADKRVITPRNLDGDFVVFCNKQTATDFYSTDFSIVEHYCNEIANIKATARMNRIYMRAPWLLKSKKNSVEAQIIIQKILSGELVIEVDEDSNIEKDITKLELNTPVRLNDFRQEARSELYEMLNLFGIYNNPDLKKERMIDKEASANNHLTESMGDIYFNARRSAIDLINQRWGYDIKVEWNSTVANDLIDLSKKLVG